MSDLSYIDFWLVRHAPVVAPQKGWLYGSTDLDAKFEDADLLGAVSERLPTNAEVHVSDLVRTEQTRAALNLPEPTSRAAAIREQHFGDWENTALSLIPPDHEIWRRPHTYRPPNGEAWTDLRARTADWLTNLKPQTRDVVVVAHAGSIRALLAEMLDLTDAKALALGLDNLSISKARWFVEQNAWRVAYVNWLP
ncbi:MAG: histidine phosphatase family protein [Alphaproteobacteria bacterium]